jgi:hypothetical protein
MFFLVQNEGQSYPKKWTIQANILSYWDTFLDFNTQKERIIA